MDDPQDATPSNSSTYKVKTLKMIAAASLKTRFHETYCRQQPFSFPDSIMHYITKNPSTSKCYQKMVKSCKYFFFKNQIIVIQKLSYGTGKGKWTTFAREKSFTLGLDNIGCKLWITDSVDIFIESSETDMQNLLSSIVPRIFRCDVETLDIANQIISYQDYCLLSTCAERIDFYNIAVKNVDGSITPLEKLIEAAPKLNDAAFFSDTTLSNITSNTVQELVKLSNFSKLLYLTLDPIPETFDPEAFYIFMKGNELTSFHFTFADALSDGYKKRLEKIIDEILEAEEKEEIGFMPLFIYYDGIDNEKYEKLREIHYAYRK